MIENVLLIGDIARANISKETLEWLSQACPLYKDTTLTEHIYNIEGMLDDMENDSLSDYSDTLLSELNMIKAELDANNCSYLRIVE